MFSLRRRRRKLEEFMDDALSALWDVLDSSLLGSGYRDEVAV